MDLYVQHDKGFTLCKAQDTDLTEEHLERLRESGTEFVYIATSDWDLVQANLEKNLASVFASEAIPQQSKNLIFSHIIIDCIAEVFKNPKKASAFQKCRTMLERLTFRFEKREELLSHFKKLERQYDKYLLIHTAKVTILAMYVYEKLYRAGHKELVEIGVGAMLHDIGMLQIASNITEKTDALTETEYRRVKLHPRYGYDMLCQVWVTDRIPLDITLSHHERFDGSGYPQGLSGQAIPRPAMLVSICDIYCALTMNRPYRSASSPEQALKTLKSERKIFDPVIFEGFLRILSAQESQEPVAETEKRPSGGPATGGFSSVQDYIRRLRNAGEDRNKLLLLHTEVTEEINHAYGAEKEALMTFRKELKDLLNSLTSAAQHNDRSAIS